MASTMACEPPFATGQPATWADASSMMPMDVVSGRLNGRKAWAAAPANSPLASSVRKTRPAQVAGSRPRAPKPARVSG